MLTTGGWAHPVGLRGKYIHETGLLRPGMGEEEPADLASLAAKIERLEAALDRMRQPYARLLDQLERMQEIAASYFRLLDLLERYGSLSPELAVPGLQNPISREIVKVLFEGGGRNISQITEALRVRRGSASRRIVRERLQSLERDGVVVSHGGSRGKVYGISPGTVRRWAQILGLVLPASAEE